MGVVLTLEIIAKEIKKLMENQISIRINNTRTTPISDI